MRKLAFHSIGALFVSALLLAGCATTASAPKTGSAPAAAQKVAKQRTVTTTVTVVTKETSYYSDGLVDGYTVYKLDDGKRLVLEKDVFDASRPDPIERTVYEYAGGHESAQTVYESDGKVRSRRESSYDASGRLTAERVLDSSGKPQSSSAYAYDAKGQKIEWKVLDVSGAAKATTSYSYTADGLSAITLKDSAGKVSGSIKLEYADGQLAKRSYYGHDGSLEKFESYIYTGGKLASLEYHRADASLSGKTAYEYGKNGEVLKSSDFDAQGALRSYKSYEYAVRQDSSVETYYE